MSDVHVNSFKLIGLRLTHKTTNGNGQSMKDCGNLWQQFTAGNYSARIPGKLTNDVLAVYYDYEGDHTAPYSFFIGCKVAEDTVVPSGMDRLSVATGSYRKIVAKGPLPACVVGAWQKIWSENLPRAYRADFEVYGAKCQEAIPEVEIFLSVH